MNPRGRVALVTGGGVRVGRAITLGLAEAGAALVIHYNRSPESARETADRAAGMGVEAVPIQADLADPEAARNLARQALDRFGRVDILVHSASPFLPGSLADTTIPQWRLVMGVLVESFLLLAQELTPGMVERGEGVLIPILDRGVLTPWPGFLAHGVGKSALWALARTLAVELAPHVRVNGVLPGPVLPPEGYSPEQVERIAQQTLLGRWGTPQDVAEAVLYLVRADYVTGEVLVVDGGERLGGWVTG